MREYDTLPVNRLTGTVFMSRPAPPQSVTPESPAIDVMIDLRHLHAAVMVQHVSIDAANAYMLQRGVRSLLVFNQDRALAGLITAIDILGDKSLRISEEIDLVSPNVTVAHFQSPRISATFACNPSGVTIAAFHGASILIAMRERTPRG